MSCPWVSEPLNCVKSVLIQNYFWSVFGHISRSAEDSGLGNTKKIGNIRKISNFKSLISSPVAFAENKIW